MKLRFKDLIREFARDPKAEEPEVVVVEEEYGPSLADGPTALILVDFIDVVDALTRLLDDETAAVRRGEVGELESFTRAKQTTMDRLDAVTQQMRAEKVSLNGDTRSMVLERTERLEAAIAANTSSLVAIRKAVLAINRNILMALEKAASEGLYGRGGHSVRPYELSVAKLNAEL